MPRRGNNLYPCVTNRQDLSILGDTVNARYSLFVATDDRAAGFLFQFNSPGDVVPMMMCNKNRRKAQLALSQNGHYQGTIAGINHKRIASIILVEINKVIP